MVGLDFWMQKILINHEWPANQFDIYFRPQWVWLNVILLRALGIFQKISYFSCFCHVLKIMYEISVDENVATVYISRWFDDPKKGHHFIYEFLSFFFKVTEMDASKVIQF